MKYFGTDGIRGKAFEWLTEELAFCIGFASGRFFGGACALGRDTRISGAALEDAFARGVVCSGCDVFLLGVLPTPAVSIFTKKLEAGFGAMISASHNPPEYNGIKLFNGEGIKLSDAEEKSLERLIDEVNNRFYEVEFIDDEKIGFCGLTKKAANHFGDVCGVDGAMRGAVRGKTRKIENAAQMYIDGLVTECLGFFEGVAPLRLDRFGAQMPCAGGRQGCSLHNNKSNFHNEKVLGGIDLWLDCGEGAASGIATAVFDRLGARVRSVFDSGDGSRINDACGALFVENLCGLMKSGEVFAGHSASGLTGSDWKAAAERKQIRAGDMRRGVLSREYGQIEDCELEIAMNGFRQDAADMARQGVFESGLGFAFDGDADRMAMVFEGSKLCGDSVLYSLSRVLPLPAGVVVGTVMSNSALDRRLFAEGRRLLRAGVGDKNILEIMRGGGYSLGGEQSGHYILYPQRMTGDGVLSAILMVKAVLTGEVFRLELVPQKTMSLPCKSSALRDERMVSLVERAEERLGRVLVRMSGTEPKVRVMAEDENESLIDDFLDEFSALLSEINSDVSGSEEA